MSDVVIPRAQHEALMLALRAAEMLENAEAFYHNDCDECEGEDMPELCPVCFPLFDDARLTRRAALEAALIAGIQIDGDVK
jgi:hypothetical protein